MYFGKSAYIPRNEYDSGSAATVAQSGGRK